MSEFDQCSFVSTTWDPVEPTFDDDVITYQVIMDGEVAETLNNSEILAATDAVVGTTIEVVAISSCNLRSTPASSIIRRSKILAAKHLEHS